MPRAWELQAYVVGACRNGISGGDGARPSAVFTVYTVNNPWNSAIYPVWSIWWLWQWDRQTARHKLSDAAIKRLETPGVYSDGDGLFIRVRKGGSKQWLFIYRRGGKRTEIGLGGYGRGTAPVPLTLAREKAEVIRNQLARGIDPREDRKPARVITFKHCMDELLASKEASWKNGKHRAQWHMTLKDYALPLHDLPVADIAVGDVKAALEPLPAICDDLYKSWLSGFSWCALNVVNWAGSGLSASWRGSMLSCRLGRSERLAAAANFPDVERYTGTNHPSMRSAAASYCGRKVDQISRAHNRIGIKLIQR